MGVLASLDDGCPRFHYWVNVLNDGCPRFCFEATWVAYFAHGTGRMAVSLGHLKRALLPMTRHIRDCRLASPLVLLSIEPDGEETENDKH